MFVDVELWINDRGYIDTIRISPHSFVNVQVDNLFRDDWVQYRAAFENGDRVRGHFTEDGRTTFYDDDGRAAGARAGDVNGRSAVAPGGMVVKLDAKRK